MPIPPTWDPYPFSILFFFFSLPLLNEGSTLDFRGSPPFSPLVFFPFFPLQLFSPNNLSFHYTSDTIGRTPLHFLSIFFLSLSIFFLIFFIIIFKHSNPHRCRRDHRPVTTGVPLPVGDPLLISHFLALPIFLFNYSFYFNLFCFPFLLSFLLPSTPPPTSRRRPTVTDEQFWWPPSTPPLLVSFLIWNWLIFSFPYLLFMCSVYFFNQYKIWLWGCIAFGN